MRNLLLCICTLCIVALFVQRVNAQGGDPSFVSDPADRFGYVNETATFTVSATGTPALSYQWRKNGAPVAGQTDTSYTTPVLTIFDDSTRFDCIVTNANGSDTSATALLFVRHWQDAPYILGQPQSQTLVEGDTARFTVHVIGAQPLSYQWFRDTTEILGATDSLLEYGPVTREENGTEFFCRISNSYDTVRTRTVKSMVKRPTSTTIIVSGELYDYKERAVGGGASQAMDIEVQLYTTEFGGAPVYRETFFARDNQSIAVRNGKFTVRLGEGNTAGDLVQVVRTNPNIYVSFSVSKAGGNLETLEPRSPLTASPYALSGFARTLHGLVDPIGAGLDAPVGTYYVNDQTSTTWVKTATTWVVVQ